MLCDNTMQHADTRNWHHAACLWCLQALLIEMARIRLHGFSEREIHQARSSMMSDVESAYIERDQDYSQVGCLHLCSRAQLHALLPCGPLLEI